PFAELTATPAEAVTVLQVFLIVTASSAFVLAALVNEMSDREAVQRVLRDMADTMPQLVWVASDDGVVQYYNRRRGAYLARHEGERIFHWVGVHPDDLERTRAEWEAATRSGGVYQCEHRVRLTDGSYRWHLSRAERLEAIEQRQWYGTSTDIHE